MEPYDMNNIKKNNWKNKKVLIAEDNFDSFLLLREILASTGIEIYYAENGKKAIELFDKIKFDIALLDIKMPEIDGVTVLNYIKNLNPEIPVIAQTAMASNINKEKFYNSGFDHVITKPIDISHFIAEFSCFINRVSYKENSWFAF
jgi:CheY-like chemotaxis protein